MARRTQPLATQAGAGGAGLITEVEGVDGARAPLHVVVNPRARRVSVRIDAARRIAIATAPSKRQLSRAAAFAAERAGWIVREIAALPQPVVLVPGAIVPIGGAPHELVFEAGRGRPRYEAAPHARLVVPAPEPHVFAARVKRFLRAEALRLLVERVDVHGAALGVRARVVHVKEIRSRWGSCSSDGVLSFSWRVIFAPDFVLDYIAAHEVAHLREMNHSARFWAHVARICPDHGAARAWFRRHGAGLFAISAN
jgi:predicted metal-dependent hydrolase